MGSRRIPTRYVPSVKFSPEGNRRIRLHIARYEDRITALVNGAFPLDNAITPADKVKRDAILRMVGEFGDYLLDTDIRFAEEF